MNDQKLLHEFAEYNSETAFADLVERHLPLVYGAAVRQTQDPALAENLAQVVFILLARNAGQFGPETVLADWLFRATRQAIRKSLCRDARRNRRRGEKASLLSAPSSEVWEQLLDDALAQLTDGKRVAVLMHYVQLKRLGEVGLTLGLSEEAVEQSLAQAIGKLHKLLLNQGVVLPETVLPGLLMTRGTKVPPSYLGPSVIAAALNQRALPTAVYALLQGAGSEPAWPRLEPRLRQAAKLATLAVVAGLLWHFWPRRTLDGSRGYSFDTRIVVRPAYVAVPPWPDLNDAPKPIASLPAKVLPTNNPPAMPVPIGLSTNAVWAPGGTLVDLPVAQGTSPPVVVPAVSSPEPDAISSPPLWSASAGLSPAQNLVPLNLGLGAFFSNNPVPWSTARRPIIVVPSRAGPPGSSKKP